MAPHRRCIFCDMISTSSSRTGTYAPDSNILLEDNQVFVIADIKPDADHHYLVITKEHIHTPKSLTRRHIPLVHHMIDTAIKILEQRCFRGRPQAEMANEYRLGFHWPPFHSIDHLHMHVLYPVSSIPMMQKLAFRPGVAFMPVESLLERIAKLPDKDESAAPAGQGRGEPMDCS